MTKKVGAFIFILFFVNIATFGFCLLTSKSIDFWGTGQEF
jgi:hypothetical protein